MDICTFFLPKLTIPTLILVLSSPIPYVLFLQIFSDWNTDPAKFYAFSNSLEVVKISWDLNWGIIYFVRIGNANWLRYKHLMWFNYSWKKRKKKEERTLRYAVVYLQPVLALTWLGSQSNWNDFLAYLAVDKIWNLNI